MLDLLPDLFDAHAEQLQLLDLPWHSYGGNNIFWGEIETVRCFSDNSRVKECLAQPGNGRVLVVDGGGFLERALLGDLIAASAVKNNWAGVVVFGAIRDAGALRTMPLGVKAIAAVPIKTVRQNKGEASVAIELAGVKLVPGMMIYADANGVAVSQQPLDIPPHE